jgi:hypothetical protein
VCVRVHLQAEGHPIANDPCYGAVERTSTDDSTQSRSESSTDVSIWLHALYHGGEGWAFRSALPAWANSHRVSGVILQVLRSGEAAASGL